MVHFSLNKNRQIIGELQDFFKHYDTSKAIQSIIKHNEQSCHTK